MGSAEHFIISLTKSILRLVAGIAALSMVLHGNDRDAVVTLCLGLIISEFLGVLEEIVDKRK